MAIVVTILTIIMFLTISLICLLFPEFIQAYLLSNYSDQIILFKNWINSKQYILSLKITGIICLVISLVLVIIVINQYQTNFDHGYVNECSGWYAGGQAGDIAYSVAWMFAGAGAVAKAGTGVKQAGGSLNLVPVEKRSLKTP